jgi:hypothetical protein
MPLRKKLQKIAEKFFGIPPPTSSASCSLCIKLKYPHYGIDFLVQGDYPSGGGRVWRGGDLSCGERTLRDTQVVYIKRPLPLREGSFLKPERRLSHHKLLLVTRASIRVANASRDDSIPSISLPSKPTPAEEFVNAIDAYYRIMRQVVFFRDDYTINDGEFYHSVVELNWD